MSKDCCNINPLRRDGTSQQQRLTKALLPGYVAVDERSMDDLIAFVNQYAREIHFFNIENEESGNWEEFFNKSVDSKYQLTEPHYALFVAFLKLFKYAQDDINQLTKKHIDFYYKDVLQLSEKSPVADQVFILFELAKHVSSCKIDKGTKLKAGKDSTGVEIIYETDKDIVVNKAQVDKLKALFYNKNDLFRSLAPNPKNSHCLYASSIANSSDGAGGAIVTEDKSWKTFGLPKFTYSSDSNKFVADRQLASIGFAFASPILFLGEGDRTITITLTVSSGLDPDYDLSNVLKVMFSGEKEWIETIETVVEKFAEDKALELINNAKVPKDIAGIEPQIGPIIDDPTTGYGDQVRDYDIGLTVAENIIKKRKELPSKRFKGIDELLSVKGFGIDKLNDIKYSFKAKYLDTYIVNNKIIIRRKVYKHQPSIVKYNQELLGDPFETSYPVVKILLNTNIKDKTCIYNDLKGITISSAEIKVEVVGVKSLILQNDFSELKPAKPFLPFTNKPVKSSSFYIGSWEVFQKKPDSINLNILWHKLPSIAGGFKNYYPNYIDLNNIVTERPNTAFKINISYLKDKEWIDINPNTYLFTKENGECVQANEALPVDKTVKIKALSSGVTSCIERDKDLEELKIYDEKTQRGFMKMELAGVDFGHSSFQVSYTSGVLKGIHDKNEDYTDTLPKDPYTPTIKELSIDYTSSEIVNLTGLSEDEYDERIEQFFHIHPFGVEELKTTKAQCYLLPQYNDEGTLYIGVKDIIPTQSLSLLFKVSEGSPDPDLTSQEVNWYYLVDNEWVKYDDDDILFDSTDSLITSGIISFSIPQKATSGNTILTKGLYWVKVAVNEKSKAIADIISIATQAVTASFKDNGNDPEYLRKPLEVETIKKLKESNASISKINQPYTSFGGKVKELDSDFYIRISERLRHKARAITIWDYERIVLQQFSSIYKVKCLNHTKYSNGTFVEMAPGNVTLIVISNVRNVSAVDLLKPRTNLNILTEIKEFVLEICTNNLNLFVMNPIYEEVKVDFKVQFHKQYNDFIYYQQQLNSEINEFLAPWAFDTDSDVVFSGKIHKSRILNFIESREYVDFVTCFKMSLITSNGLETGDIEIAEATTSASILTSTKNHSIQKIGDDNSCDCDRNEQFDIAIAPGDKCSCDK